VASAGRELIDTRVIKGAAELGRGQAQLLARSPTAGQARTKTAVAGHFPKEIAMNGFRQIWPNLWPRRATASVAVGDAVSGRARRTVEARPRRWLERAGSAEDERHRASITKTIAQ